MKTSWSEWQWREDCLLGGASGEQRALFNAKLLLDTEFRDAVYWQRATYHVIRDYNRVQLREELRQVHQRLFADPAHRTFAQKIKALFT
ncbi:hypothetical protein [Parapedobacter sp. 10938]|uniref:hypothetical protein n=1 Tax=Parapedobacter flavus TaxID=3110225 RepID=UPI002DB7C808|nr:hypothetical protein [Parapedobacter sp. 10938]MEC3881757.1 hypothetical protein [Parapedobacter sp. 10938]